MRALATVLVLGSIALPASAQDSSTARDAADRLDAASDAAEPPAEEPGYGGDDKPDAARDDAAPSSSAPEVHTVQPGDTLWNLSQRFLNNPWYWPKIWSYNQNLDNPNWIYPGSQIRSEERRVGKECCR